MLVATLQDRVAWATWRLGFLHIVPSAFCEHSYVSGCLYDLQNNALLFPQTR
jgi:hypothetical protein